MIPARRDPEANAAAFAAGENASFDHEGSMRQLVARWRRARRSGAGLARAAIGSVGVLGALALVVVFVADWILAAMIGVFVLGLSAAALAEQLTPRRTGDARKHGLVDALLAYLARELDPGAQVRLHVDYRSPLLRGHTTVDDPAFDFDDLARPDGEPHAHDWLRLEVALGDVALRMRVRSLSGRSGQGELAQVGGELRIRDEVAIELVGEGLATSIEAPPEALRTELLRRSLEPTRARLLLRGRGVARRVFVTEEQVLGEMTLLEGMVIDRRDMHGEVRDEDLEWLLAEGDLAAHIEYARTLCASV